MNNRTTGKASQSGVALIVALLAVLVLSILAAAIMTTSQAQIWTAINYRLTAQSRYAAESRGAKMAGTGWRRPAIPFPLLLPMPPTT